MYHLRNHQHLKAFSRQLFPASPHQTRASMSKTGDITKITTYVDEHSPHHSSQKHKSYYQDSPTRIISPGSKHKSSNAPTNYIDKASWVLYHTASASRTYTGALTRPAGTLLEFPDLCSEPLPSFLFCLFYFVPFC